MPPRCATVARATRRASIVGLAPPPSDERRSELTDFLRTRRAQVTPQDAGLPADGRRRTPGLRREEVAQLAGVGLSWYTWLEQGRDITPSAQVLDALARVLRLDPGRARAPVPPRARRAAAPGRGVHAGGAARADRRRGRARAAPGLPPRPARRRPGLERRRHRDARRADARARRHGRTSCGGCSRAASPARSSAGRRPAPRSRASAPSTPAASATRTSPRSSRRWRRPARSSATGGRATRSWPSSSGRRRSSTRGVGRLVLHHLQSAPTSHPDLRLIQFVPADEATREALARLVA